MELAVEQVEEGGSELAFKWIKIYINRRGDTCLFFLLRLSTDTFAALSSAPCWSTLVGGEEEVDEKVEELRWMRNCSAMSRSSFLGRSRFFWSYFVTELLRWKEEV